MKTLYIVGVNYFDYKLIDAINAREPTWEIAGFLSREQRRGKEKYLGEYRIVGDYSAIAKLAADPGAYFFNNYITSPVATRLLRAHPSRLATLIHPSVDTNRVSVGGSVVLPDGCVVGQNTRIGHFVKVANRCLISHDVTIEDNVFIGPNATVGGNSVLRKRCFIGMGAVIMNVTVGERSVVGAGAVVIRDVPPDTIVVGVPARPVVRAAKEGGGRNEAVDH